MRTRDLFGIPFIAESKAETLNTILELATVQRPSSVTFVNAHVSVEAHQNPQLRGLLQKATINVPDGKPIAWLLNAKGENLAERYSGPDLMSDIFKRTADRKHFFIGSTPETIARLKANLPHVNADYYSPPFGPALFEPAEINKHIQLIEKAGADFIWVGLGAPRQERYVVEVSKKAKRGVWLAVGAAFDFVAGTKPRAPEWVQNAGMEWAFRMASEPKRLAPRYFSTNPKFLFLAAQELLKSR